MFDGRATAALTGSPAGSIVLAAVRIKQTFVLTIGTPTAPIASAAATLFVVGEEADDGSSASGSQQICWNFGAAVSGYTGTTVKVLKSNTTGTSGLAAVQLNGTGTNTMECTGPCSVGWGVSFPAQAYTLATLNVSSPQAKVTLGSGGTVTTVNVAASSEAIVNCAFTTLNLTTSAGKVRTEGTGAITTANVSGNFISNSTGTITTLNVEDTGIGDFSQSNLARTVTTIVINGGGRLLLNNSVERSITITNGVDLADGATTLNITSWTNTNVAFAAI